MYCHKSIFYYVKNILWRVGLELLVHPPAAAASASPRLIAHMSWRQLAHTLLRHQWASHGAVVWGMVTFVVAVAFLGKFGSTSTVATMTGIDTRPPREFF